ncbi:MAG: hypothetical protein R2750_11435 [Bacteroidales bacterium]
MHSIYRAPARKNARAWVGLREDRDRFFLNGVYPKFIKEVPLYHDKGTEENKVAVRVNTP